MITVLVGQVPNQSKNNACKTKLVAAANTCNPGIIEAKTGRRTAAHSASLGCYIERLSLGLERWLRG